MLTVPYKDFILHKCLCVFNVEYVRKNILNTICTIKCKDDKDLFFDKGSDKWVNKASGVCTSVYDDGSGIIITNMSIATAETSDSNAPSSINWARCDTICTADQIEESDIYCMNTNTFQTTLHEYKNIIHKTNSTEFNVDSLQILKGCYVKLTCSTASIRVYLVDIRKHIIDIKVDKDNLKLLGTFINVNINTCSPKLLGGEMFVTIKPEYFNSDVIISQEDTSPNIKNTHKENPSPVKQTSVNSKALSINNKVFAPIVQKELIGTVCTFTLADGYVIRGIVTAVAADNSYVEIAEFDIIGKYFQTYKCFAKDIGCESVTVCIKEDNSVLRLNYKDIITDVVNSCFTSNNIKSNSFVIICPKEKTNESINVSAYVKSISENELILHITETELIKLRKLLTNGSTSKLSEKIVNRFYEVSLTPNEVPCDIIIKPNKDITDKVYTLYEAINMFLRGYKIRASEWADSEYIWWDDENLQTMDNAGHRRYDLSMLAYDSWKVIGMV